MFCVLYSLNFLCSLFPAKLIRYLPGFLWGLQLFRRGRRATAIVSKVIIRAFSVIISTLVAYIFTSLIHPVTRPSFVSS